MPLRTVSLRRGLAVLLLLAATATGLRVAAQSAGQSGAVASAPAVAWTTSVSDQSGLPVVTKGGTPAVSASYAFWGPAWSWAGMDTQVRSLSAGNYRFSGRSPRLGLDLAGRVDRPAPGRIRWQFDLNSTTGTPAQAAGGIVFRFNLDAFAAELGQPELLPERAGWAWGRGATRLEMRFDPAPALVAFDPDDRQLLRVFFYDQRIPAGRAEYTATLAHSADVAPAPNATEKFGAADASTWPADIADWANAPVDLSFLNQPERPAGKRGFVQAAGERLIFDDGTPARFWGTNLTAFALFMTPKDAVRQQARRLSQLGFNLVRLHHHDSPWVTPNLFGDANAAGTRSLAPAMLDRLHWWIKCLKDEGIYVWLDLHVQRALKAGDGIQNFAEIAKGRQSVELKGYNYVNPSIVQAMKEFNQAYLTAKNPYTGLRLVDDPAVAVVMLTNENDVTHHFGNALLADKGVPAHHATLAAQARQFAATWGLPAERTLETWKPGPAKLFLNDLERRFNADLIAHLRTLGLRAPIVTTSTWGNAPLFSLPALTSGNLVDAHAYGRVGELERNPVYSAGMLHWLASGQVAGRPFSVSEWNVEPFPVPDRHLTPLLMAGTGAFQGWDAVLQYAYSQAALDGPGWPSNWHAYNDPALLGTLPAAALLYRQGHVQESPVVYAFSPTREQLFERNLSAETSPALRTAAELGKLVVVLPQVRELPWLEKSAVPAGARPISDPGQPLIPREATEAVASTGELRRNWSLGTYTINTPRTQAALGWLGGRTLNFLDVSLSLSTGSASVAVQSLDGRPIRQSRNLMISLAARAIPQTPRQLPFHAEPVEGRIGIIAPAGLRLYAATPDRGVRPVPFSYQGGRYSFQLDASLRSYWLFLR